MKRMLGIVMIAAVASVLTVPAVTAEPNAEEMAQVAMMKSFLGVMKEYTELAGNWMKLLEDQDAVAFLVAEGIAEIYEQKGDKRKALPELRKLLETPGLGEPGKRAIRFKIRDIYKEAGMHDEALTELKAILQGNPAE